MLSASQDVVGLGVGSCVQFMCECGGASWFRGTSRLHEDLEDILSDASRVCRPAPACWHHHSPGREPAKLPTLACFPPISALICVTLGTLNAKPALPVHVLLLLPPSRWPDLQVGVLQTPDCVMVLSERLQMFRDTEVGGWAGGRKARQAKKLVDAGLLCRCTPAHVHWAAYILSHLAAFDSPESPVLPCAATGC